MAASDTATDAGAIGSYSAFDGTMSDWQEDLVRWRCGLSEADRRRFGAPPGWNCKDVKFFIGKIAFDQLSPHRAAALNKVETRFKLPPDQVDMLITAGRFVDQQISAPGRGAARGAPSSTSGRPTPISIAPRSAPSTARARPNMAAAASPRSPPPSSTTSSI
jgi:hypothetical protein